MSEKISPVGKQILKELSQPPLEYDAAGAFPSTKFVYGTSRQLNLNMLVGQDEVYAKLAHSGLITMTPVQGLNPPEFIIEITDLGANAISRQLIIPLDTKR